MMPRNLLCATLAVVSLAGCSTTDAPTEPASVVTVAPPRTVSIAVTGVSQYFQRGQTGQLTALATLSNGFVEDRTTSVQWQSTNNSVASVNGAGAVTAGDEGDATIRASLDGVTGEYAVRVRYGNRTPDPAPGQRLPLPNEFGVVASVFASRPDLVARSCQAQGGTWELMELIVDSLRQKDLRWSFNGKNGDANSPAEDEVAYHWGAGPSEGSRDVYVVDVIGSHCGSPGPVWFELSVPGVWITRGRY